MSATDKEVVVLIEIDVMPHAVEAFAEALRVSAADRAAFDGCTRIDAYHSAADPTLFTLVEVFRDQATIDAYYASESHRAWMASIRPLIKDMRGADQRRVYSFADA